MEGETDEGGRDMAGSKLDLTNFCGLHEFLVQPTAPSPSMAKGRVQQRTKRVKKASNIKSVASVSANSQQICWCEGFGVGCGRVRSASTRRGHAKLVKDRKESK